MEIRQMRLWDYKQVIELWRQTEHMGLDEENGDSYIGLERFIKRNQKCSFVAVEKKRIVAAILCGHDGRMGLLHHLAVDKEWRKRGLGRELARQAILALKNAGIGHCLIFIYKENTDAQKFWQKLDFKPADMVDLMYKHI